MLFKLALANVKNRLRDYLVLLAGLVMSSAIFYMFADLATNQSFLKANTSFKFTVPVFYIGEVLLVIITLVYVMYANSFLLNMRLHDYGLFMMLGAKKRRVGWLMVIETLVIGGIATVIGLGLGISLTSWLASLLFKHLGLVIHHFNSFYPMAVITTASLYLILFLIASFFNLGKLIRTPVLRLLKQTDQVDRMQKNGIKLIFTGFFGIILLMIGYSSLHEVATLQLAGLGIALVTITLGSYFIFKSTMTILIAALKKTNWAKQGLNNFTLSQIMFRIRDYTKILTITSLLFALALGAITVGTAFNRQIDWMSKAESGYTLALNDPTAHENKLIQKLTNVKTVTYSQKYQKNTVIYNEDEFIKNPFVTTKAPTVKEKNNMRNQIPKPKTTKVSLKDLKKEVSQQIDFLVLGGTSLAQPSFKNSAEFSSIETSVHTVKLITVRSIAENRSTLEKLNNAQNKAHPQPAGMMGLTNGTFQAYLLFSNLLGGLEFMGYFLGIAFLAMLASCLMFKILSGTQQDQHRYELLTKLGTKHNLLKHSINREVLVLFALPGILGIIDVLFGLQMFSFILADPYYHIQYPILIFIVLYLIYYFITIWLYKLIVLKKRI